MLYFLFEAAPALVVENVDANAWGRQLEFTRGESNRGCRAEIDAAKRIGICGLRAYRPAARLSERISRAICGVFRALMCPFNERGKVR